MKHLGLFEGIGGFSLAASWMGWDTVAWCEIDPFCQKVLRCHFPEATGHSDIKQTDFTIYKNAIDIISGGFPCQPFSTAGKQKGTEDARHLWPEMLRAIREVKPTWVVGENVRGLVSWSGGLVFDQVQSDLEAEGYEVQPFLLPACGVNAPHQRYRIWFAAYCQSNQDKRRGPGGFFSEPTRINVKGVTANPLGDGYSNKSRQNRCPEKEIEGEEYWQEWDKVQRERHRNDIERVNAEEDASNTNLNQRCERRLHSSEQETTERHFGTFNTRDHGNPWENFPTQSPVCNGDDGLSARLDGITFSRWRRESIKAAGNAIVPQVALQIFKAIEQYNNL